MLNDGSGFLAVSNDSWAGNGVRASSAFALLV
jgi:hypothetical protein